jgi:nitroimidazol reductase NimA-like FMN-containing flavoprotein (pyridoxamine 5'-phosphate oxidase superfamily)
MRIKKALARLITWERVCRVAISNRAGVPHVVPVCHVLADGRIYFASDAKARKVRNLRANPHCAITVDLYSEEWSGLKGVMVRGDAAIIERGPRFRKIRDLLYEKYPQYPDEAALAERESVMVEVKPTAVFSWGFDWKRDPRLLGSRSQRSLACARRAWGIRRKSSGTKGSAVRTPAATAPSATSPAMPQARS